MESTDKSDEENGEPHGNRGRRSPPPESANGHRAASRSRPNVVVVVLDTARAKEMLPISASLTPALSSIVEEGTEYANAFAAAPWTVPSHASLFTGTYANTHGTHGDHPALTGDLATLAEAFRTGGYETVGVSNNTWITEEFGFDRGFDRFRRGWQFVQSDVDLGNVVREKEPGAKLRAAANGLFDGNPLVNAANVLYSEFVQSRGDDGAERTTDWIETWLDGRDARNPFFLFVNYIEPHIEYRPPREYAERFLPDGVDYEEAIEIRQDPRAYDAGEYHLSDREFEVLRALYRGAIAYVDEHIARLRAALEASDEWEDTVFVVVGDHGENVGEHGFLGHQYNVYDTLLHVPLVISGGAFSWPDRRVDDLVQVLDLGPTLLDAADLDAGAFRERCEARSFHPNAGVPVRDAVFAEYVAPQPPIERLEERFGSLPDQLYEYDRSLRTVRTDEYKLIRGSDGTVELYDVERDPGETHDVSDSHPERVDRLGQRLEEWGGSDAPAESPAANVEMSDSTEARLADLGYL